MGLGERGKEGEDGNWVLITAVHGSILFPRISQNPKTQNREQSRVWVRSGDDKKERSFDLSFITLSQLSPFGVQALLLSLNYEHFTHA